MHRLAVLSLFAVGASAQDTTTSQERSCVVQGATVRWSSDGAAIERPGRASFSLPSADGLLRLRSGTFDPRLGEPAFSSALLAPPNTRLFAVQFHTAIVPEYRAELESLGLEVVAYWPQSAYLVRGERGAALALAQRPFVRWIEALAIGHKLEPALHSLFVRKSGPQPHAIDCNVVLADKADRARLIHRIEDAGGLVLNPNYGSIYVHARLSAQQLLAIAASDDVLWVDRSSAIEVDMNFARIQGGANAVEFSGGMTGTGVRVHVLEGLQQTHRDWTLPLLIQHDGLESHGHCTGMIVAGNGAGNTNARGLLPNSQIVESSVFSWGLTSRFAVTSQAIDPAGPFRVMQATASWGHAATLDYTSVSAELDSVLFDLDLATTQSQSNTGTQQSRPQAWAKNVISVGGVWHYDNANPVDDTWARAGASSASIGPASDGRIKPDLCAYYDSVGCGDLMGADGYSQTDYTSAFGGTSAATPIVNGYLGLAQQMFTDGAFGHRLPTAATAANRFWNKPHMTTAKALLCSTAASYAFSGAEHDLTRTHQGWGFPAIDKLWQNRSKMLVVDESETLTHGASRLYYVYVAPGTPELRATLTWADPPAIPSAAVHRVNDLDLEVRYFHDGRTWNGNKGLDVGNASAQGGTPDRTNTMEQVWLPNPTPGIYAITVTAAQIVVDGRVETPEMDADFALVAHPMGAGYRSTSSMSMQLTSTVPGDLRLRLSNVPTTGWVEGFTFASLDTQRPFGFGAFFGIEFDHFTAASLSSPAWAGDPFHFVNGAASLYPYATYVVPAPIALQLQGATVDAFAMLFDATGRIAAMSNISRAVIR